MLISSTAYIVDGWFVGNFINAESLAVVSVVMPIFSLLFGISLMFSSGGVVQYAKYIGEDNSPAAFGVFTKIIVLQIIIAITISFGGLLFGKQIIHFLGATDNVYDYAISYYNYVILYKYILCISRAVVSTIKPNTFQYFSRSTKIKTFPRTIIKTCFYFHNSRF